MGEEMDAPLSIAEAVRKFINEIPEVERAMPGSFGERPGLYGEELDSAIIGIIRAPGDLYYRVVYSEAKLRELAVEQGADPQYFMEYFLTTDMGPAGPLVLRQV